MPTKPTTIAGARTRKGIWDERNKKWIKPSGTVKQGRRPMFKPFKPEGREQ
jgi:hypothetical protein